MKQRVMIWAILASFLGVVLFSTTAARADEDKLPKSKKLVQVQKKIKSLEKEIKLVEKGKHESVKKQTEECDALGEEVDAAEEEWKKAAEKLDEKTRKELLEKVQADPDKRISEYMSTPEGVSKSDFFICVGAAKKLVDLQNRYDEMDAKLVDQMDREIKNLEKKLTKPQEEEADLLAEYQEAVLLDALSGCKTYKDKSASFPVEELAKHVGDLRKTYKSDFDWSEDDVWKALEDAWTSARPCIPKSERKKSEAKKTSKTVKTERTGKAGKTEKTERSASRRGSRRGKELQAGDRMVKNIRGVEFPFRWCPPGKFMMGEGGNQHEVTLTQGFWILETEVTQAMWFLVMGNNPSKFQGANRPVEEVTWDDCQEFCRRLSSVLKMPVSLPTEAQWEYACRAGTTGPYAGDVNAMGWFNERRNFGSTHPVGQKQPNAWGLYDMHGNVWEWCWDYRGEYPNGSVTDPRGPNSGSDRIFRSGSWKHGAQWCCSFFRGNMPAGTRYDDLGFRFVVSNK